MLIDNQKTKSAVAAKSAKWGLKRFSSFPMYAKFSGLSGLSGLVPNYACPILNPFNIK